MVPGQSPPAAIHPPPSTPAAAVNCNARRHCVPSQLLNMSSHRRCLALLLLLLLLSACLPVPSMAIGSHHRPGGRLFRLMGENGNPLAPAIYRQNGGAKRQLQDSTASLSGFAKMDALKNNMMRALINLRRYRRGRGEDRQADGQSAEEANAIYYEKQK